MLVNVADLTGDCVEAAFSFRAPLDVDIAGVTFAGDAVISGKVVFTGTAYRAEGTVATDKTFVCSRCLEQATRHEIYSFAEEFAHDGQDSAAYTFDGTEINLDRLVSDTVILAQPIANVCSDECKGLCPKCGQNLNIATCSCDDENIDPRLAELLKLKL